MKRFMVMALVVGMSLALVGVAFAQMGGPGRMWGGGWGGYGMMGGPGPHGCPGMAGFGPQASGQVTEDQAKVLAQQYADQYLKGFKVDKVLPFTGRMGAMYSVELKGPDGQVRSLHINPWGNVMPFGGPFRSAG